MRERTGSARRRELALDVVAAFVAMLLVPLLISLIDGPFSFADWYGGLWPWSWLAFTASYFGAIRVGRRTDGRLIWRILNGVVLSILGTGLVVAVFFVVEGILRWDESWPLIPMAWILAFPAIAWISGWIWIRETRPLAAPDAADSPVP